MALKSKALRYLVGNVKEGDGIVSLGYPDIICSEAETQEFLGDRIKGLTYREDSESICKRHGMKPQQIPDAESFFECLGCTLDVFDIVQERGCEIIVDLNHPIPANACEQFEWALDVGTLEHCFNIAQALVNVASLVKTGGTVIHENPFNWGNHGFYNLNPTLFHDYYTDNGFSLVEQKLLSRDGQTEFDVPATKRFTFNVPQEFNLFTIVRRDSIMDVTFPTQTKYRKPLIQVAH